MLAVLAACGEGVEAPAVIGPEQDTGCPKTDDAVADTKAALAEGLFQPVRPVMDDVLRDQNGLTVLVRTVIVVAPAAGIDEIVAAGEGVTAGPFGTLTPHLVNVLRYVDGTGPFIAGEHYEPLEAVHDILAGCDIAANVTTFRKLLELQVDDGAGGTTPWLQQTIDAIVEVASDPEFIALLDSIELDDEDTGGQLRVGRDAFVLLARLAIGNAASPNFDPQYVRSLIEDVLLRRVDPGDETRAKVGRLLDLIEIVIDPQADIFPDVQSLLGCANRHDEEGRIAGMLFDYLTIEDLSYTTFLQDIGSAGGSDEGSSVRDALLRVARALEAEPRITSDAARVLAALIAPEYARAVVPFVLKLKGRGVATELTQLLDLLAAKCGG